MYYTLQEAASALTEQFGKERLGASVTEVQLLRAGIQGQLLISVPLDTRCYSPTVGVEVDAYGLFVVPPRHLFVLEAHDTVKLEVVHSLDGKTLYFPFVAVRRDMLRVADVHLQQFAKRLVMEVEKQDSKLKDAQLLAAYRRHGGAFDAQGNLNGGVRGALAAVVQEDGRSRKTVTDNIKRALDAERGGAGAIGGLARQLVGASIPSPKSRRTKP